MSEASSRALSPWQRMLLSVVAWGSLLAVGLVLSFGLGLRLLGMKPMYVVSDSMVPTFQKGDMLVLSTHELKRLSPGDIIGYRATWAEGAVESTWPQKVGITDKRPIVTHRVVKVDGEAVTVKGDNNLTADPVFKQELVVGKIVAVGKGLGFFFTWPFIASMALLSFCATYILECFAVHPRRVLEEESRSWWRKKSDKPSAGATAVEASEVEAA